MTGPAHWKKCFAALGRCGRRDEIKNKKICRLTAVNLTKRVKGIYKNVSNVKNLIFK
jgi:hypothetical protein